MQSYDDFEIVVIDDGSSDDSFLILNGFSSPKMRVLQNDKNRGLIYTLNRGIAEARGELVARMDADDISNPDRLEKQVAFLDANPDVAMVGSLAEEIDSNGVSLGIVSYPLEYEEIQQTLIKRSCFCHPSVMFRKNDVLTVGGYRDKFRHAEDYDLWLRLSESHRLANIGELLIKYRIHANQVCFKSQSSQFQAGQLAIAEALERRGIPPGERHKYFHSLFGRASASPGTIGRNYINFAHTFNMMGDIRKAWRSAALSVLHSPVSVDAWRAFLSYTLLGLLGKKNVNIIKWYFERTKQMFMRN